MSLVVNNNIASLNAQHNLSRTSNALAKSLERLSSGLKINRGADGPAALVISELQRAQIAGLQQAIQNTEKGVAQVQTAEGALTEINALLVKARALSLDSANAAVNDSETLAANQSEVTNLLDTIDRIASNTQFGKKHLLDGSSGITGSTDDADVSFVRATTDTTSGTYAVNITTAAQKATVDAATAQTAALAADENLLINGVNISLGAGLTQTQVIDRINEFTGQTGVVADSGGAGGATRLISVQFGSAASISAQSDVANAATSSGIGTTNLNDTGVDIAGDIAGNASNGVGNVLTGTAGATKGISLKFGLDAGDDINTVTGGQGNVTITDQSLVYQIGPNSSETAKIAVDKVKTDALGLNVTGNQFTSLNVIDIQSTSGAQDAVSVIDQAISDVSTLRGRLGAFQSNTLQSTANNLRATLENTQNAESVIRDTDFASEVANFTKQQVLAQVGVSVLSSSNQTAQLALSLLGK